MQLGKFSWKKVSLKNVGKAVTAPARATLKVADKIATGGLKSIPGAIESGVHIMHGSNPILGALNEEALVNVAKVGVVALAVVGAAGAAGVTLGDVLLGAPELTATGAVEGALTAKQLTDNLKQADDLRKEEEKMKQQQKIAEQQAAQAEAAALLQSKQASPNVGAGLATAALVALAFFS